MTNRYALVVFVALGLAAPVWPAEEASPPSEPWGYLYQLRTQQLHPLTGDESPIGRLTENAIVLSSPRVSRRHAVLQRKEGVAEIVDVGSTNGSSLNGSELRPRAPRPLSPGDLLILADESFLYHESLPELWADEIRHRLLASIVKLRLHVPQDRVRKSFGKEETLPAVTEARVSLDDLNVEVEHSVPLDPESGFPQGSGAFVGNVHVNRGVLELSLWTLAAGDSMTSRRASFTNLKHATLRIEVAEKVSDGTEEAGAKGPWFPPQVTAALFEVFPDDPEFSLQFAHSLASQDTPLGLQDAAASLAFRHRLAPAEWKLLVLAAQSKGLWVERQIGAKGLSLADAEKVELSAALEQALAWLERARELGADDEPGAEAEAAIERARDRLARLSSTP